MTTESLGISVPIPGKKTIFYQKEVLLGGFHATCSVARFRFRYRDLEYHRFGSETDSESPFSLKSVPSPIPRRDSDRESRCFGSETREPGISGIDWLFHRCTKNCQIDAWTVRNLPLLRLVGHPRWIVCLDCHSFCLVEVLFSKLRRWADTLL